MASKTFTREVEIVKARDDHLFTPTQFCFVRRVHSSKKVTGVPFSTLVDKSIASQLVRRMQPCEAVFPTLSGSGVP
jgi:hypothetical protein